MQLVGQVKANYQQMERSFIVLEKVLDQLLAPVQDEDGFTKVS
jgi:hypothetical protein